MSLSCLQRPGVATPTPVLLPLVLSSPQPPASPTFPLCSQLQLLVSLGTCLMGLPTVSRTGIYDGERGCPGGCFRGHWASSAENRTQSTQVPFPCPSTTLLTAEAQDPLDGRGQVTWKNRCRAPWSQGSAIWGPHVGPSCQFACHGHMPIHSPAHSALAGSSLRRPRLSPGWPQTHIRLTWAPLCPLPPTLSAPSPKRFSPQLSTGQ